MSVFKYKITYKVKRGLKIENPKQEYFLYFRYRQGRKLDFIKSLGLKVAPIDWDIQKQRLRQKAHLHNREQINSFLNELEKYFEDRIFEFAKQKKYPTRIEVNNILESFINPPEVVAPPKLFEFIRNYIEQSQTKPNKQTKKIVSTGTTQNYKTTLAILERFNDEVYKLTFDNVNIQFYYDFIKFCESQNLTRNYIGKHIKQIKAFLREATEQGLNVCLDYQKREFSIITEQTEDIYLTVKELTKIYHLDTSKDKTLDNAKDLFILGAFTGLRVSDFNSLKSENFYNVDNVEMIKVSTQKTNKTVSIPMHPIIKKIFKKYNHNAPPPLPPQTINRAIKQLGKLADLKETTPKAITRGGLKVTVNTPKYELIKNHTARRSFCTNAYLSGIDPIKIMAISGHTTEKNFLKYIKVTGEQIAVEMSKHKFFNTPILEIAK